jgi:arabinogalactan endo-1,4-beta-galactosidase
LSYYPIWHGKNLEEVKSTIITLGQTYNKKVIIAETSYPFTLGFKSMEQSFGSVNSALIVGVICLTLAIVSVLSLKESFSEDLNYIEYE